MLATYLIGVQAVAGCSARPGGGVVLVVLLVARTQLHRFATPLAQLSRSLHDGLMLAALALVVLPLMPDGVPPWLSLA